MVEFWLYWYFNQSLNQKLFEFNQNWMNIIKNRSKLDRNCDRRYDLIVEIQNRWSILDCLESELSTFQFSRPNSISLLKSIKLKNDRFTFFPLVVKLFLMIGIFAFLQHPKPKKRNQMCFRIAHCVKKS